MLVVIDTNVLVSGLRSVLGASNALLQRAALGDFRVTVSTALCLEYDDVLNRPGLLPGYTPQTIAAFLDSYCAVAREAFIYFRWRPFLTDPGDDLVFECALAAGATHIITHNVADFRAAEPFGISIVTPAQFVSILPPP
ncbi:putative toxin-antitoxin system toxin component, PIN family [Prosthecobacter sp.]|uniref:putative toxin-antitoxin system toxin component, PIN family n=1 Tax=Prosthecobacter sp. TaxID=1965333 RepID=UPI0037852969